jgi:hypothetical protein
MVRAADAVYQALKRGKLVRPSSCEWCGGTNRKIQAHHEDYSKPLEVIWLCIPCHSARHGMLRAITGSRIWEYVGTEFAKL